MSTSKSFLTALFLLSVLFTPLNAQDDPHIYWEFNTEPVDEEEYLDEHILRFVEDKDQGCHLIQKGIYKNEGQSLKITTVFMIQKLVYII